MKVIPISRYRFFQAIQPLSILTKVNNTHDTGCLHIFSPSACWSLYLEQGKLVYACYQDNTLEILYRKLRSLSKQFTTLPSNIFEQLETVFAESINNQTITNPDYLAICWLVNRKYISFEQAGILIEQIAFEVIQSFLKIERGSYEFISESDLDDLPKFCHLDLASLTERCQAHAQEISSKSGWEDQVNHHELNNQSLSKVYTIVCIDDQVSILNTVRNFLDEQIFDVVSINNPLQAVMQILRLKPDLILIDTEMPKIDGYELCSLLRKNSSLQTTPVIMMTKKIRFSDRIKAKLVKSSGYLIKPFTQKDLLKILFHNIN